MKLLPDRNRFIRARLGGEAMKQYQRSISTFLVATALTMLFGLDAGAQRARRNNNAFDAVGSYAPGEGTYEELSREEISQGKITPIGTVLQMDLSKGRGGKYTAQIEIIRSTKAADDYTWRFVSLIVRREMFELSPIKLKASTIA